MRRELILLTGATGFVGFQVLLRALKAGYAVRCVIDGPDDLKKILSAPSLKALNVKDNQLFWTMILDMTAPGAFKDALKCVKYVVHCAAAPNNLDDLSPTFSGYDAHTALKGVVNLLEAAHNMTRRRPNIFNCLKRIVVTTSVADLSVDMNPYDLSDGEDGGDPAMRVTTADGTPAPGQAAPSRSGFNPPPAGKTSTLSVSKAWVVKHRPSFDVVFLLPAWVLGHHELAASTDALEKGPNGPLIRLLKGAGNQSMLVRGFVSIHDLADTHMAVMQDSGPGGNGALVLASEVAWPHAQSLLRKAFPRAYQEGIFRTGGRQSETQDIPDEDEDSRILRIKYRSFEETAVEVARQYLDLDGRLAG
ncbi:hypothetical protein B0T11DRAFT_105426 [Plectosphaerella cucumerina]|jgi:nucleoside-diphosphate-sugar epimerase|uniref:NAD-dependent epimerase/dehydratase domain-containing protein n=1 Tax=Plectosphaerella cucumerina TaxID=40658 RepID=A0A8K0X1D7_9PEZI|nr:hypothetical protein B0T11DRAFT_105426 [Plectosphaerella cucumerina]